MKKGKIIEILKNKKKIKLQLVEMSTKNLRVRCNLHGSQKFVQVTKYGSAECEQCFNDIKEFIKSKEYLMTLEQRIVELWKNSGMKVIRETVRPLKNGKTKWEIIAEIQKLPEK